MKTRRPNRIEAKDTSFARLNFETSGRATLAIGKDLSAATRKRKGKK
jgi:hypothetical protein